MPYKDPEAKKANAKAHYEVNKVRILAATKAYYEANRESTAATQKVWRATNKGRKAAVNKAWDAANPEKVRAYQVAYGKTPRGLAVRRAYQAFRRALKLKATPPWADREELNAIWMGRHEGHHVDHIHPLKGKLSCGLNVPWNLQYLPEKVNVSKKNKLPPPGMFDWAGHHTNETPVLWRKHHRRFNCRDTTFSSERSEESHSGIERGKTALCGATISSLSYWRFPRNYPAPIF
jgi:hypothetical protein